MVEEEAGQGFKDVIGRGGGGGRMGD